MWTEVDECLSLHVFLYFPLRSLHLSSQASTPAVLSEHIPFIAPIFLQVVSRCLLIALISLSLTYPTWWLSYWLLCTSYSSCRIFKTTLLQRRDIYLLRRQQLMRKNSPEAVHP